MNEKIYYIFYGIGLIFSIILMIWILFLGRLNFMFLFFYWIFKFLSGFGIVFTITCIFLAIMKKTKERISKRGVNTFIFLNILVPVLLILYNIYQIYSNYNQAEIGIDIAIILLFDAIIFIAGIITFLLFFYIVPIVKEQFHKMVILSRIKRLKKGAKGIGRGIKKRYFIFCSKHAQAQIQDQMTIKETLDCWQKKLTAYLILPIIIGTIIFTPIAFICLMFWLKIFIFEDLEINTFDKIAFLISIIVVCVLACIIPFISIGIYATFSKYFWTINIFYIIGVSLASSVFIFKFLKLKQ
ncbi:MAG: hypothetical protein ACFFDN_02215 [Candidatus Hodarchaeota archaeon]